MNTPSGVSFIIPVYNNALTIRKVVEDIHQAGYSSIVVVDDGSQEDIQNALLGLQIHYLRHEINRGQGAALKTGLDFAKTLNPAIVITFDADGQHDASDIPALLAPITTDACDITLGSRFLKKNAIPAQRRIVIQIARRINFLLTGLLLSDAHNGLRAMNTTAFQSICIREKRMAHATEIIAEIKRLELRYQEVPVTIHYTDYSKLKGQRNWNSISILFDLLSRKLFK